MATTVENPFDTQQPKATNTGIVGGAINNVTTGQNATAQSLAQYNPMSDMSAQAYTPQTREVNQATETAAGQVNSLLANDNPLLQRARTLAKQGMAQRGLVNSSMSQGAGVAAMIDRITPIAQQDAQTYSNRSLANMEATNEAGQFNVGQNNQLFSQGLNIAANTQAQKDQQQFTAGQADLDRSQQTTLQQAQFDFQKAQTDLERAFQATQQDKSIKAQTDLQNAQFSFQQAQNQLDRAQQLMISNTQVASNERLTLAQIDATAKNLNTSNQAQMEQLKTQITNNQTEAGKNYASTLTLNATNQINAILADGNLDATAKQGAIDNLIRTTNASLQWASTFYNTTLPTFTAPGGTGTVINPGAGAGAALNNQFKSFVETTLAGPGTPAQKAAAINAEAGAKGLTREQISVATGVPLAEVNAYLAQASNATASTATNTAAANTTSVPTSNNVASTAAAAPAPVRSEVINEYVSANLSNPAAISQAAISNGVSLAELASSVGVSQAEARAYFEKAGVAVPR